MTLFNNFTQILHSLKLAYKKYSVFIDMKNKVSRYAVRTELMACSDCSCQDSRRARVVVAVVFLLPIGSDDRDHYFAQSHQN